MSSMFDRLLKDDSLAGLAQKKNFMGWVYSIDYEWALIMTNDLWKARVGGVPHNCFLVATTFDPERFSETPEMDREIILLRVVGSAKLPQDDGILQTKIDHFQDQEEMFDSENSFDEITLNQIQFGGLRCRILGTFYKHENQLWLGSDIESFSLASRLRVYRPTEKALTTIVNHVDPVRSKAMRLEAENLGLKKVINPIPIGTVRYTSTDRLHRKVSQDSLVPVSIQPADFLARRTAVLGMTRTGKSNMVKQTVSMVKRIADEARIPVGQIIFDINGEYANANQQDNGSLADVYQGQTIRYRGVDTPGFADLRHNFYVNIQQGLRLLQSLLQADTFQQADLDLFKSASLDSPDAGTSESKRWEVRRAAYLCLLYKAGFQPPSGFKVRFPGGQAVRKQIKDTTGFDVPDPSKGGLDLDAAEEWFLAAREADLSLRNNGGRGSFLKSTSGKEWFDPELRAFVNLLARRNDRGTLIRGYQALVPYQDYHSPRRVNELISEIYSHLLGGKIVILDLSVGPLTIREEMSQRIAAGIFERSMHTFVSGKQPGNIVIYVEEAHNLMGRKHELTDTWPRIAKEGAKYRIGLVYATQEPSSVHPNILANTENWFVTHLNNEGEVKEISKFYDFKDFAPSLLRAQDVGFARVKTLSGPFVIPTQINLFDAETEIERQRAHSGPSQGFEDRL